MSNPITTLEDLSFWPGSMAPGARYCFDTKPNHHMADRRGRYYYCNCMRTVKLADKTLHPGKWPGRKSTGRRFHTSCSKRVTLWASLHPAMTSQAAR